MPAPLPSFTALTSQLCDLLQSNAFSQCQLLTPSSECEYTLITTSGGCMSAFEIVGINRYLTDATEEEYIEHLDRVMTSVLRAPHHRIGINFVRDQSRNTVVLDDMFQPTIDTIQRMGIEAAHFYEDTKRDLSKNCAFERTVLTVVTEPRAANESTGKREIPEFTLDDEKVTIDSISPDHQNNLIESNDILQTHKSYCKSLVEALSRELTLTRYTSDEYLLLLREEEELTPLNQTRWRAKKIGDPIDISLNNIDNEFIAYPPLAYQIVTSDKEKVKNEASILSSNDHFVATIDREFYPIDPQPFSQLMAMLPPHIPIRMSYDFQTGTDQIVNTLNSKKSWLMFFLIAKQSRMTYKAIESLIDYSEDKNGTLLAGHLSVATWAKDLQLVKEYKKDISQALTAWGTQTVRTPTDTNRGYYATLPAYSATPSARRCIQPLESHLTTLPVTRPIAPMASGGMCLSNLDGRLFPINPATSEQDYSLTVITGGMGSGKTVFSSVYNNCFVFGEGNTELPLIAYIDYGSGVHNYLNSLRNWLTQDQQYKIELIKFNNVAGNAYNLLEPQFGLEKLENQEESFCTAFLTRVVRGTSKGGIHSQLSNTMSLILKTAFTEFIRNPKQYEHRIGSYIGNESQLHSEIEELIHNGAIELNPNEIISWFYIRDKLYDLGSSYLAHARFCHRQGSGTLPDLLKVCNQDTSLRASLESYTVESSPSVQLLDYIIASISGLISRFEHIFSLPSQIDVSQARIIGVDLRGITSQSSDDESKNVRELFGMLANHLATRNHWRSPEDFFKIVPVRYSDMYRKIIAIDSNIKKHWFMDEYRQYKSDEFDALVDNGAFIARKYNTCITVASQRIEHPPQGFFHLATNRYILSLESTEAEFLQKTLSLTGSFISEAAQNLNRSKGFGRTIMYVGQFKKVRGLVVQLLRNYVTPSYLWNFASDAEDEHIKSLARFRFGERDAFRRLATLFPTGSAMTAIETRLKSSRFESQRLTREDVIMEIMNQLAQVEIKQ